tara:strand:- start:327 stop:1151 length:825 start_codon:yes stop_codon:yes gene_type:complete
MKDYKFLALLVALLMFGCSDTSDETTEVEQTSETVEAEEMGPPFSEYMTCTPGPDFNMDTARQMIDEWNDLDFSEGFEYAAGHVPLSDTSLGGDNKVYWQLFWNSKENADSAWSSGPSPEFVAWSEKYQNVLTCDTENRRGYDFYVPYGNNAKWNAPVEWVTYAHYCKFNNDDGLNLLQEAVVAFNAYLDETTNDETAPFIYGVYRHNGDNPEPYKSYDFFWMNYYESHAEAETSYARFVELGSEVQAMFDASATCEGPNASDSYQFYPDPDGV